MPKSSTRGSGSSSRALLVSLALHLGVAAGGALVWTVPERVPQQATVVDVRPSVPELRDDPPPAEVSPPEVERADEVVEFRTEEAVEAEDDLHLAAPTEWRGPGAIGVLSEFEDLRLGPRTRRVATAPAEPVSAASTGAPEPEPSVVPRVPGPAPAPPALTAARPLDDNDPPRYPERALRRGWTGVVVLDLHVAADGAVQWIEIVETSGHRALDLAATRAARGWRFEPARRGDDPVESVVRRRVRFAL